MHKIILTNLLLITSLNFAWGSVRSSERVNCELSADQQRGVERFDPWENDKHLPNSLAYRITTILNDALLSISEDNLILKAVRSLKDSEQSPATFEKITEEIRNRLKDKLSDLCFHNPEKRSEDALQKLALNIARAIKWHCDSGHRRVSLLTVEDIQYLSSDIFRILQKTNVLEFVDRY